MILTIDLESDRPIYRQIADAVRRALLDGSLKAGDKLPPGRELASMLDVNLETVQRAYRQLAREGLVTSRVGRGTRVADSADVSTVELDDLIRRLAEKAGELGMGSEDLVERVRDAFPD